MNRQQRRVAARQADPESLCAAAIALKRQGKRADAVAYYRKALAIRPTFAEAHNNIANLLKEQGLLEEAIEHLRKAIALRPDLAETRNNLGNALKEQGRLEDAIAHYRDAIRLKPGFAEAHHNLGTALVAAGRLDDATAEYRHAIALKPDYAEARINHGLALVDQDRPAEALAEAMAAARLSEAPAFPFYHLGALLARCGASDPARICLERSLARDADDRLGARLLLAALGFMPVPERASNALLERVYAERAQAWDQGATGECAYRGAELVVDALRDCAPDLAGLQILDAGCGTGLVGTLLAARPKRLEGVDLSTSMLAQAERKAIYDQLHHRDMIALMAERAQSFDAVTCAATLIHFGDLEPAFRAAATCLRHGGVFILTLFPNESDEDAVAVGSLAGLAQGGCYVHGRSYVRRTAEATGFAVEKLESRIHEYVRRQPQTGLIATLRRCSR